MLAEKSKRNTTVLKYSGTVPYIGKHNNKVMKVFRKLEINIGISNNGEKD